MSATDLHSTLRDTLLSNEDYLTRRQQEVVTHDGPGVVRACPGSGKTRALAARLAYRISKWDSARSGIAALSFTNVAVEELTTGLGELGVEVPGAPPHFIGTIDSFVYQHITGPHLSALIPEINARPELLLQGRDAWVRETDSFCVVTRRRKRDGTTYPEKIPVTRYLAKPDGQITWRPSSRESDTPLPSAQQVMDMKLALAKSGYISMSDSMYYAYRILSRYPQLTEGLASRYPQIVIDECQDTSDVQHEIISALVATGKTQVLMIGDPYQAIYEFNDANPQLMLDRISKDGWPEIPLTDNFRSSAKICAGVTMFFPFSGPMESKGRCQHCRVDPLVLRYPDSQVAELPGLFSRIVQHLAETCTFDDAKIVARSNNAVRELRRLAGGLQHEPSYCTARLIAAATNRDAGLWGDAFREAQACLCRLMFDRASLGHGREPLGDTPYKQWRHLVWSVVTALPASETPLTEWVPAARDSLTTILTNASVHPAHKPSGRIRLPSNCPPIPAASVVASGGLSTSGHRIDTVHKVKGQTLDGIMLVASPQAGPRKSSAYSWLSDGSASGTTEEQRIAYVAMTRPRKLLVVAVPESAWADCSPAFSRFREIDPSSIPHLRGVCSGCPLST